MSRLILSTLLILISINTLSKDIYLKSDIKITGFDPATLKYAEEWELSPTVYETLIKPIASEGFLRPSLAESWKYKSGTLKFNLRKETRFSNGDPINAKAVKESFLRYLLLDKNKESILYNCLKEAKNIKSITESHPSITIQSEYNISFKIKEDCKDTFLKEIAQPIYGIVYTKNLKKDLSLTTPSIVSGAFNYKLNNDDLILYRNSNNWAWFENKSKLQKIIVSKNRSKNTNVLRTGSIEVFNELQESNQDFILSLPNITWYLTYECKNDCDLKKSIIDELKYNLPKIIKEKSYSNVFNTPADSFFPASFNCPSKEVKKVAIKKKGICLKLDYGSRRTNEAVMGFTDKALNDLGYKTNNCENPKVFKIYPQFLHDEIIPTLDFLANTVMSINNIGEINKYLPNQNNKVTYNRGRLCTEFSKLNFTPLYHSRIAFFYSDKPLKKIFFKSGGYISLIDLPFVEF